MAEEVDVLALGLLAAAPMIDGHGQGGPAVEVAVDAPGASRTYDYAVPDRLVPIEPGEAVLVEFGRSRQALGVILGPSTEASGADLKPLLARVHADGPLLPPLTLVFARWISNEYLAPPAATLRSMLPPGMLERLELVAEWLPQDWRDSSSGGEVASWPANAPAPVLDGFESAIRDKLANGPQPARNLEGAEGRPALLRRLRAMAGRGLLRLEWTLTKATAGPRFERWLILTDEGRRLATGSGAASGATAGVAVSATLAARLGPRQRALLEELATASGVSRSMLSEIERGRSNVDPGRLRRNDDVPQAGPWLRECVGHRPLHGSQVDPETDRKVRLGVHVDA